MPLVLLGIGTYLAWFGVHYWRSNTKWPTDPVKSVLQGNGIPKAQTEAAINLTADIQVAGAGGSSAPAVSSGAQPAPSSGAYDHSGLMSLWTSNGGNPATADVAAAIAMAESSGRASVTSSNPDGGTNVGLWQLDTKGKGAGYTVAQLQDPATNARVAILGSANGTNWSAWATYASGAYRQFL